MSSEPNTAGTSEHGTSTLLADQEAACARLTVLARTREATTTKVLPIHLLPRWSVPFLVGPSGSGKEIVCRETARRLGDWPYRRWEVGSWTLLSNRASGTTLDQIEQFIEANPRGCLVYLAGIEALRVSVERSSGWHLACVSEVEQFLDWTASRPTRFLRRDGGWMEHPRVLVAVGGRFAGLWGEREPGGPEGAEAWKHADREHLADAPAVAAWLSEHSGLPSGIHRRLTPRPDVLRPITAQEAAHTAQRLHRCLPSLLDGIEAGELAAALQGPEGWRAVTHVIEEAIMSGHEDLPGIGRSSNGVIPNRSNLSLASSTSLPSQPSHPDASSPATSVHPSPLPLSASRPPPKPNKPRRPPRLADWLGLPGYRSTLLPAARRLGLASVAHLEALATARGYTLPGSEECAANLFPSSAWQAEFCDLQLAVALLSPGLQYDERAICRGVLVLSRLLRVTEPLRISREAGRERSYRVIRHVAALGHECQPQNALWHRLLSVLPPVSPYHPNLPANVMPDPAIREVFSIA